MNVDPLTLFGLLAFSVASTLVANWLVAGLQRPRLPQRISLADGLGVIANLVWITLVYFAGMLAARYIERITSTALGYLVFGTAVFLLSVGRATLYRRITERLKQADAPGEQTWQQELVHGTTYVLFAIALYLALSWLVRRPAEMVLLIPLCLGTLLPGLDSQDSVPGRLLPFVSHRFEARFGAGQEWHTLVAVATVALLTTPLILLGALWPWCVLSIGFLSHLLLDTLMPRGVMWFWPISRTRYRVLGGPLKSPGDRFERALAMALAILTVVLLAEVGIGPAPAESVPVPSYEQTLEQYYAMRGKSFVYPYLEGTWQVTGRRIASGRGFEILNASGDSFVVLDRYSGEVFTAGRSAADNLYINRIILEEGPSARIKPAEVHLQEQQLADALPVVYEMQQEPGLQHIYVHGELIMGTMPGSNSSLLQPDYSQMGLRRIQINDMGQYALQYLTADELIALANLPVKTADLVIVASYASPASGPTVTPLPSPPPTSEP